MMRFRSAERLLRRVSQALPFCCAITGISSQIFESDALPFVKVIASCRASRRSAGKYD